MQLHLWQEASKVDFLGWESRNCPSVSSLGYLATVNVVIWAGLFFYLWRLDRRISARERER
ncbi:MAG TPA: CcmD family protein [Thermoanaerobaculia bacterium]|nr:CcmD family protein [Thermoanaerobaculia bacterium]